MSIKEDILFCRSIVPDLSRTFADGIEPLRAPLSDEIGTGYLLFRILDALEVTTELPADRRVALLTRAASELADERAWRDCARAIERLFAAPDLTAREHMLARVTTRVVSTFHCLRPEARNDMRFSLSDMALGMAAKVRRELAGETLHVASMAELERYASHVAGTVGELLTNLFVLDREALRGEVEADLRRRAVQFGLGLLATHIIKSLTDDVRRGIAHLPATLFESTGIDLPTLVNDPADPRGREIVTGLARITVPWLEQALEYALIVPAGESDIRLFCALPPAFAARMLGHAFGAAAAFRDRPLELSATEIRTIHARMQRGLDTADGVRSVYEKEKERILAELSRARG